MMDVKATADRNTAEQIEQRSLSTALATAAVTGTLAGAANATTQQLIAKVTGKSKAKE